MRAPAPEAQQTTPLLVNSTCPRRNGRLPMTQEQEVAAIPLVEERAKISKREVETGRVRIHVTVDERQEEVPVDLASEEVEIERVPVNKAVSQLPSVRLEG